MLLLEKGVKISEFIILAENYPPIKPSFGERGGIRGVLFWASAITFGEKVYIPRVPNFFDETAFQALWVIAQDYFSLFTSASRGKLL